MRVFTAASVLALLSGCASLPDNNGETVLTNGSVVARSVELCKTLLSDLQAKLGTPSRDGRLGKVRIMTWVVEWDPLTKYLGVMADETGTVVDLYWNLPSEVQWTPTNRCL